ncbi:hypothetical protein M1525_00240 [Patescibacteria group bacterium]|nr:hypothetical protein [Patescibacteria group bacterium]
MNQSPILVEIKTKANWIKLIKRMKITKRESWPRIKKQKLSEETKTKLKINFDPILVFSRLTKSNQRWPS